MSKAILILDKMPSSCFNCPVLMADFGICRSKNSKLIKFEEAYRKPDWCPLKEVPEKYTDLVPTRDLHSGEYEYGWNACIDEILGER